MKKLRLFNLLLLSIVFTISGYAQDLESFAAKYTAGNGTGYLQPFADAFGANLNSGFFRDARIPENGFRLQFGLVAMSAAVKDQDRVFTATTDDFFTPQASAEVPTIFGSTEGVSVSGNGGTVYNFPGGMDVDMLPLAVPQISIGAIKGTELMVRFFASDLSEDIGSLNLLGLGVRHSIDQYLPQSFPVSLAVGYYWQTLSLENFAEANTSFISAQASFKAGPLILYGGPGYESASLDIDYTFETGEISEEISLELESSNSLRMTAGVGLQLGPLYLNADYNLGNQNIFSVGLGFSIGNNK